MNSSGPFIGRRSELARLREVVGRANGSVTLLSGEAGIGKTRILREVSREFQAAGGTVLWGSCYEGGPARPFGPWAELAADIMATIPDDLRAVQLPPVAAVLGLFIPEVALAYPSESTPTRLEPEQERIRIFDAFGRLIYGLATERPILVVIDDLHWADRDSLQLFRYQARLIRQSAVSLIGVYRDPEIGIDAQHPLSELLSALAREVDPIRLHLPGLTGEEIAEFIGAAMGSAMPQALVREIQRETAGNPFYAREVVRYLIEERKIVQRDDRWTSDFSPDTLGIPPGVRQVVMRRLARLSAAANDLVRIVAACSGRASLPILAAATGSTEEAALDAIDEALAAGILVSGEPAGYDFAHAIVRHTILASLIPDRRARLHRRVADALLDTVASGKPDVAAEIAEQFARSADLPGAATGIEFALFAANQARAVRADDRTLTFLRIARDLARNEPVDRRAEILSQLAVAEAETIWFDAAMATVDQALGLLNEVGDERAAVRLCVSVGRAFRDGGAPPQLVQSLVRRGISLARARHDLDWARLKLLLSPVEPVIPGVSAGGRWLGYDPEAVAIARSLGDQDDDARTLEPFEWRSRLETEHIMRRVVQWDQPSAILRGLDVAGRDWIYRHSALHVAHETYQRLLTIGERYGSVAAQGEALAQIALCHVLLGEFHEARLAIRRARDLINRLGPAHRLHVVVNLAVESNLAYLVGGDWPALGALAERIRTQPEFGGGPFGVVSAAFALLCAEQSDQRAAMARLLHDLTATFEHLDPRAYLLNGSIWLAADVVWKRGLESYADRYRTLGERLLESGVGDPPGYSNDLVVGRMLSLLGRFAEAGDRFQRAVTIGEQRGQRPLGAIARFDWARSLGRDPAEHQSAIESLTSLALAEFRALGMEPWQRAASEWLAGRTGSQPAPGWSNLTDRELEVLRLLASGRTNREIAAELVLVVPTVQRHIANIYAKIGARGRADAIGFAISHRLHTLDHR